MTGVQTCALPIYVVERKHMCLADAVVEGDRTVPVVVVRPGVLVGLFAA